MGIRLDNNNPKEHRFITPFHFYPGIGGQAPTIGRVYLSLFEVDSAVTIDQVSFYIVTANGNVTMGIYGPLTTEETAAGAPLAATTASTALSGTNGGQWISLTSSVVLQPGRYYLATEFSDGTATFGKIGSYPLNSGWAQYYDRGGGYGALTDPCPATTAAGSLSVCGSVRCVQ